MKWWTKHSQKILKNKIQQWKNICVPGIYKSMNYMKKKKEVKVAVKKIKNTSWIKFGKEISNHFREN